MTLLPLLKNQQTLLDFERKLMRSTETFQAKKKKNQKNQQSFRNLLRNLTPLRDRGRDTKPKELLTAKKWQK
jgi:hypothetical protein